MRQASEHQRRRRPVTVSGTLAPHQPHGTKAGFLMLHMGVLLKTGRAVRSLGIRTQKDVQLPTDRQTWPGEGLEAPGSAGAFACGAGFSGGLGCVAWMAHADGIRGVVGAALADWCHVVDLGGGDGAARSAYLACVAISLEHEAAGAFPGGGVGAVG